MAKVATPLELSVPAPSVVPPSMKVTEPVGVTVPELGVTVAVKVTLLPVVAVAALAARAVVVGINDDAPVPVPES